MKPYTIKEPITIPYFDHDHKSLKNTIENSSSRRNMSKWQFIKRKVRNILLNRWAYTCPLNGWRVKMHKKRGVTIGDNTVIGAGSVVTKDIPSNVIAVGNPCKVLREVNEHDREFYFKDKKIDWNNI
mgnify:CR=1 FL=1